MSAETCHVYIIAHIKGNKPCSPVKIGISSSPSIELMCDNFRGAFKHFLGDDQETYDMALEMSGLLDNEAKLAQWRAHSEKHLNDNLGASCQ